MYRSEFDYNRRERRKALYKHVLDGQPTISALKPYFSKDVATLQRIANGTTATPQPSTDIEMSRFLCVKETSFEAYLAGEISLKQLIDRQGEYKISSTQKTSVDSIFQDIILLSPEKKLEILLRVAQLIGAQKSIKEEPAPKKIFARESHNRIPVIEE